MITLRMVLARMENHLAIWREQTLLGAAAHIFARCEGSMTLSERFYMVCVLAVMEDKVGTVARGKLKFAPCEQPRGPIY